MLTALGLHSTCLLVAFGTMAVEGREEASETIVAFTQRDTATCALRSDGVPVCWGKHPSFPALAGVRGDWSGGYVLGDPFAARKLPKLTAISLSEGHGWGITHEGNVVVWGPFPDRLEEMARGFDPWDEGASHELHKVDRGFSGQIVAVDTGACARRPDGEVVCWPLDALDQGAYRLHDERDRPLPAGPLHALGSSDFAIGEGDDRCVVLASAQRVLLDPRDGAEPWRVAPLRCDPPLRTIGEIALAATRPCVLDGGRLQCQAPSVVPGFDAVQSWGEGDVFDPESGWVCRAEGTRVSCATASGDTVEVNAPGQVSALSMRGRRVWLGTDDGRVAFFEPGADAAELSEQGRIDGPVAVLGPSGGSQWCAANHDGSLWWNAPGVDAAERVKVRGRAVELACVHSTPHVRVEPGGLFSLVLEGRDVEGRRVLRPGGAVRVEGRARVRARAGVEDVWLDARGGAWKIERSENGRRLVALERPEPLRGLALASGPDVYSPSSVQTCLVAEGGEVHCARPRLRELDVSRALDTWRTKVDLPGPARALVAAGGRTCAHLVDRSIHCWGPLRSELVEALQASGPLVDLTQKVEQAR